MHNKPRPDVPPISNRITIEEAARNLEVRLTWYGPLFRQVDPCHSEADDYVATLAFQDHDRVHLRIDGHTGRLTSTVVSPAQSRSPGLSVRESHR